MVEVVRYTTVDDCGRAVNPMILHGQTHGGIAQGVGQALWEHSRYDPDSGQLLAGSMIQHRALLIVDQHLARTDFQNPPLDDASFLKVAHRLGE